MHMIKNTPVRGRRSPNAALGILLLSLLPASAFGAFNYEWSGPQAGGSWTDFNNWLLTGGSEESADYGVPTQRTNASLQDTAVDRNIVIDRTSFVDKDGQTQGLSWIRNIYFTQTTAAVNQLTVDVSYFRVGNNITLEATGGGTSKLTITNQGTVAAGGDSHSRLELGEATQKLIVGNGGVLEFAGINTGSTSNVAQFTRGDVEITNGGKLVLRNALADSSNTSTTYTISQNLSVDGGEIVIGEAPTAAPGSRSEVTDVRLTVMGDFQAKDTAIRNVDTSKRRQLWLRGVDNVISGSSTVDAGVDIAMVGQVSGGTTKLSSSAALNDLYLRGTNTGTVELNVAEVAGGNVGMVALAVGGDRTRTLRLANNLVTRSGIESALRGANLDSASGNLTYTIDTNGYTYDISAMESRWFANTASNNVTKANWNITGGGTFITRAINLSNARVASNIGDNTTIVIKGGAVGDSANFNRFDSSEGGTISESSTIIYDGESGSIAQITSNRSIGKLVVLSGTLEQSSYGDASYNFEAKGGIEIGAKGRLRMFGDRVIYTDDLTFVINSAGEYGSMTVSSGYNLDNVSITLSFEDVATLATYNFFDGVALSGRASAVLLGGVYNDEALSYDSARNLWVTTIDGQVFAFSDVTGQLTVVPEPALAALLLGLGSVGLMLVRRRRR